jgi:Uma2 family endonuclease
MRVLMLEPPPDLLEDRRRKGLDHRDEVWDGVVHVVPPPSLRHQEFESGLEEVLRPLARLRGLGCMHNTGLFRGDQNYRVPDLMVFHPKDVSERGVEAHAEVVIELLSPHDESREQLPFYESAEVSEVFLIDPGTRAVEQYVLRGGRLLAVLPDGTGAFRSEVLGLELRPVAGPRLRLTWDGGSAEV